MPSDLVPVTVRFVTIMQKYSGKGRREVEMELPAKPDLAVGLIIEHFQIPWEEDLERYIRIFINKLEYHAYVQSGELLKGGDTIAFIPVSGGG